MPDLNFGDSDKEALAVLKTFARRVDADLYNHGKDGMKTQLSELITAQMTREQLEDRRHKQNRDRLNIIIAIVSLIALYIGLVLTFKKDWKGAIDPAKLFHSIQERVELSWTRPPQDVKNLDY